MEIFDWLRVLGWIVIGFVVLFGLVILAEEIVCSISNCRIDKRREARQALDLELADIRVEVMDQAYALNVGALEARKALIREAYAAQQASGR